MKLLLVLVMTIAVSISISFSGNTLQYQKYLFLDSLPQTDDETSSPQLNNVDSFGLISIHHLLSRQHNPTLSLRDLLTLRQQHSLLRAEALSSSSSASVSQRLSSGSGEYMMTLGVGTPPKNVSMLLDTGSDISWLQCLPCTKCYNQSNPIFDPRESSSFSQIACGDSRCKQLQPYFYDGCSDNNMTCLYNMTYMDMSSTNGTFSNETLTLGPTKLRNISLGCGHDNEGGFPDSAGLLGLGRGNLSFITQTKDQFQGQFSYCLAYWFSTTAKSYIVFGPSAVPTRKADVYTPLVHTNTDNTFYYVNLTGISVDGTLVLGINSSVFDLKSNGIDGGVFFDSGTTYTQLIKEAYVPLREAFRKAIQNQTYSNVSVGQPKNYSGFDTCYNISTENITKVEVPMVELHFDQGANMTLPPDNTIVPMYVDDTVATFCFAFSSNDWYTIIGNIQQQSIQIVYDLSGGHLGFRHEAC